MTDPMAAYYRRFNAFCDELTDAIAERRAPKMPAPEPSDLDRAWGYIAKLGGHDRNTTSYAEGFNDGINAALAQIESLGGRDPATRNPLDQAAE
jgi:hypothetical protein